MINEGWGLSFYLDHEIVSCTTSLLNETQEWARAGTLNDWVWGGQRTRGWSKQVVFLHLFSSASSSWWSAPASVRGRSEFIIIFFIKMTKHWQTSKKCINNSEKSKDSSCWRNIMKKIIVILFMLLPHIEIPWNLNITMLLDGEIEHLLHCFMTPLDCTNCGLF